MSDKQMNTGKRPGSLKHILQSYGTIIALAAIIVLFAIAKPSAFLKVQNFINISRQMAALMIISIGATIVMAVNEFDLSIGTMASLGGVIAALLAVAGVPIAAAFILTVLICLVLGFINGSIVAGFKVLSFITTLGVGTILDGVITRLTGGSTVFENIPKSFSWLGTFKIGKIPLLSILMVFLVLIFAFIMKQTPAGRKMMAIGGGVEAAKIAGIPVVRYKILAFTLCGALAGFTGIVVASRVGSANTTAGAAYFLQSYAAAYIGCTVSREGVPNIPGTFVGVAILSVLGNGLTILQMPSYMQDIITGLIIIAAIIIQKIGQSKN